MQAELLKQGHTLLLACSEYDPDLEFEQVRKFVERSVDGLILVGEAHHPDLRSFLTAREMPFIQTFIYSPETHGTCVGPDNHKALYRMTNYLADLGHRRFGVIAQSSKNNDRAQARLQGIHDALAERSIAIPPQSIVEGEWSIHQGRALFRRLLDCTPMPTAIICGNAYLAVGALLESQACGIAVPDTMSIVGYDDIEIMSELPIPITTLRVLSDDVGRRAARHLLAMVERRPDDDPVFECAAEIVVRASSGPPPRDRP